MANIKLNRTVFDKRKFNQSVDTEFSQLVKPDQEPTPDPTVDEFFEMYTDLFYEIPKEGETNSHTFLIKESGEYVNFDQINNDIQVLLEEITALRTELLEKDQTNLDLQQKVLQAEANVTALQNAATQI
jgi:hypothetical protein